jgi:hypothetical protein
VIIRILGEGQFEVPDSELAAINHLDAALEVALRSPQSDVGPALDALLDHVRSVGTRPAEHELFESDVVLPFADATEDDIRDMLGDDGLVPG